MIPLKLKLNNFMSHEDSEIDFTKLGPATLIIGQRGDNNRRSIGSGKSSIFEAIRFVLFGQCRATEKKNVSIDNIIMWGKEETSVEFTFKLTDDKEYSITRSRSKLRRSSKVDFSVWTGGKWISVGDRKKDTQIKIIESIGCDYVVFENSVFFKQGEVSTFADMTSGERKDIVKKLLQIEKYETYAKVANEKHTQLIEATKTEREYLINNNDCEQKIKDIEKRTNEIDTIIRLQQKQIGLCEKKSKELQDELLKHKEEVSLKFRLEKEIKELEDQIDILSTDLSDLITQQAEYQQEVSETVTLCELHTKDLNILIELTPDKDELKERMEVAKQKYADVEIKVNKARDLKAQYEAKVEETENSLKRVQEFEEGTKCPNCFNDLDKTTAEAHLKNEYQVCQPKCEKAKGVFAKWTLELDSTNQEIARIKEEVNKYNKIIQDKKLLSEKLQSQTKLGVQAKINYDRTTENIAKSEKQQLQNNVLLEEKREKFKKLTDIDIEAHQEIQIAIGQEQQTVERCNQKIASISIEKGTLLEQDRQLKEIQEEIERVKVKLQNRADEEFVYAELAKTFGKNGIQALILENSSSEIEQITNELLKDFTDGVLSIAIQTLRKNKTDDNYQEVFDIDVRDGTRIVPFEMCSGGERFQIAFAIRIAFSLLSMRKSKAYIPFILYDEAFNDLDADSIEKLVDIFFILQKHFKLQLIITHITELKSKFTDILLVYKDAKGSKIVY